MTLWEAVALVAGIAILLAAHSRKPAKARNMKPKGDVPANRGNASTSISAAQNAQAAARMEERAERALLAAITLGAHLAYEGIVGEPDTKAMADARKTCRELGIDWDF